MRPPTRAQLVILRRSLLQSPPPALLYSSLRSSRSVRIVEAGPRDGLQSIKVTVPTATKIELITRLADTGLADIEATSFVSPKWVPQLADGAQVMKDVANLQKQHQQNNRLVNFPVLAPNLKGLLNAHNAGAREVVVFASATEAFSKANQNCTVAEGLDHAENVAGEALRLGLKVRGVVSCIFSDPFSGPTQPETVLPVVKRLLAIGCYEVGLGDTLGVGSAYDTQKLLEVLLRDVPADMLAGHFHDTYGQGVANVLRAYDMGLRTFDSSVAGLGGCPYAPGAKGNVATEDIVYALERAGANTGVDLDKLTDVGQWISSQLSIPYGSRAGTAIAAKRNSVHPYTTTSTAATDAKPPTRSWTLVEDRGTYRTARSGTAIKITLTRPRNGNALTLEMLDGLTALYRDLANDPSVYHIVLAAEGKFFCTGMDLSGSTDTSSSSNSESSYYERVLALYDAIDQSPQTTIALVDRPCFGGGVGLTFVCDVRLVSSDASWTLSEVKIGVSPAVISKYLVRELGPSVAREAMLSGRVVHPAEIRPQGAIHAVEENTEALERALDKYLDQLQKCAPRAAAINKELVRLAWRDGESDEQAKLVESTFYNMMTPGSEGEHGIAQFQRKIKDFSWREFWQGRSPMRGLRSTVVTGDEAKQ
ncbi:Putative HMGL-like domain-containing protein [[Torrubiella] hemipterigena]|uniref:hydroxymethylglutaryl-CoA lyase n=1 Tax=[Torrubiella] hemipterigena TaxID=1531966 RepID=A0A0A1TBC4_9HYPO|nr:Putative HMGL-like domain-containing protein [[Torrubiella] hemipterigena]